MQMHYTSRDRITGDTNMDELKTILEIKGLDEKKQDGYIGYASVAVLDRDREIIDPKGWKLENYRKNPVILTSHDYSKLPVGRALWVQPDENGLKVKFVLANTETGKEIQQLIDEQILNAFSVGFRAEKYIDNPGEEKGMEHLKDSGVRRIYTSQELLEISLVGIPSCPDALIQRALKGEIKSKELKDAILSNYKEPEPEVKEEEVEKAGKVLSKKNRSLISDCVSQMMNAIVSLKELLDATDEAQEEEVVEDNTEPTENKTEETQSDKIEITEDDITKMFEDIKKNTTLTQKELDLKKRGRVIITE